MVKHTRDEVFQNDNLRLDFNLIDFWEWYTSDLLYHPIRGSLSEFIVAKALDALDYDKPAWAPYDLMYRGKKIEIKSSAYYSDSTFCKTARVAFSIKKQSCIWDTDIEDGYRRLEDKFRHSDYYIFCYLREEDKEKVNPMALDQWDFYILSTFVIDRELGDQSSISLGAIRDLGGIRCSWDEIRDRLDALIGSEGCTGE